MKKRVIFIIGLILLLVIQGQVYAAPFINYFTETPIIDSLSSTCWGAADVGPRDQSNGLEDRTMSKYCYWDGGIIKGEDGRYHMFASRWDQSAGHNGWFGSAAIHATSTNLYGPYTDQGLCWPNDQAVKAITWFPFNLKMGGMLLLLVKQGVRQIFLFPILLMDLGQSWAV
ncbi:hypothetical protein [Ruminiclostridium josui]|uniref:hypothetical protein n=1 Tax=Ruminiclostridium josui TaxID=1499 RepID=UPI000A66841E|nr:hypothetical protein [Ruminiclostridium josui]